MDKSNRNHSGGRGEPSGFEQNRQGRTPPPRSNEPGDHDYRQEAYAAPTVVVQTSSDGDREMSFDELRRHVHSGMAIVRRRWWAGLIAGGIVFVALWQLLLQDPVHYMMTTVVRSESSVEELLRKPTVSSAKLDDGERILENHVEAMMSRRFRERFALSFSPEMALRIQEPYLDGDYEPSTEILEEILGSLVSVERQPGRDSFFITVAHTERSTARAIARQFTSEYRNYVQEGIREARLRAVEILNGQEKELAEEIRTLENKRRDFRQEFNLITVEENQSMLSERLRQINEAVSTVRIERAKLETQLRETEEELSRTSMPFDNPILANYGNIQTLRVELERLKNEQEILATQLGPNHPRRKDLEQKLAGTEEMIKNGFRLAMAELKGNLSLAIASEKQLNDELKAAFGQSLELDRMAGEFNELGKLLAAKQAAHADLLRRLENIDIDAELPADVMTVEESPYSAGSTLVKKIILTTGVVFASFLAFIGVPLAFYALSERISGNMDIETEFSKEVLGVLPSFTRTKEDDRAHIVRDNVELADVENFLGLVAQIDLSSKFAFPKVLLITSTIPSEGKSTCSSNIASTYTRYGRKTVLLDCDFRRPVQQRIHNINHDRGILDWASQGYPMNDNLLDIGGPLGLTILPDGTALIPSGGVDVQPGHVLVAWQMAELIRRLQETYDMVILDSPPAGVFQDACILGKHASETILVVREGRAHTAQVKKVLTDLEKANASVLGFVLNMSSIKHVHPTIGSRYGYGKYGYGKDGYSYNGRYSYRQSGSDSAPAKNTKAT